MPSPIACPDQDRLREMLSGTLPDQEHSALTSHLDTCPTCRQTLEDLATDGESWSDMVVRLKNKSVTIEPALQQAMVQIKTAAEQSDELKVMSDESADLLAAHHSSFITHHSPLDFLSPPDKPG